MIGKKVSHYKILKEIGGGGMGLVYKAHDLQLGRYVALKFLPKYLLDNDDQKQRFLEEARSTSTLDHPNICTIYEVGEAEDGQAFIAMAYYDGHTVRETLQNGPLSIDQAISITAQVAQGLDDAHRQGIVHRDVKAANLMLTRRGLVKILDFGVAKLAGKSRATKSGSTVGTTAYMAPEQVRGVEVDARADIWSLGVCLYEMLTGKLPFEGDHEPTIVYAVLHDQPKPIAELRPEAPPHLERIVERMLHKDVEERYQRMEEVLEALAVFEDSRLEPPEETDLLSLVGKREVLLGLGIATAAASVAALVFWASAFNWSSLKLPGRAAKETSAAAPSKPAAVRQLEANFVGPPAAMAVSFRPNSVEPSREGPGVAIVNVRKEAPPTAPAKVSTSRKLPVIQRKPRRPAAVAGPSLPAGPPLPAVLTAPLVAPDAEPGGDPSRMIAEQFLAGGQSHLRRHSPESLTLAVESFRQAIDADPTFAPAYTGLAESLAWIGYWDYQPSNAIWPHAEGTAAKALTLDRDSPSARAVLAASTALYHRDWPAAEKQFRSLIEEQPKEAAPYSLYAVAYLLPHRELEQALQYIAKAREIEPTSAAHVLAAAEVHRMRGDRELAQQSLRLALRIDSQNTRARMGLQESSLLRQSVNRPGEKRPPLRLPRGSPAGLATLAASLAASGDPDQARQILDRLLRFSERVHVSPFDVALVYASLGDRSESFEWLEKAYDAQDTRLAMLNVEPAFRGLRVDLRFTSMLKKAGLGK